MFDPQNARYLSLFTNALSLSHNAPHQKHIRYLITTLDPQHYKIIKIIQFN